MTRFDDLSRSLVALDQDRTLVTVVELSASSWLAGGLVPGVERRPLKKLEPDRKALPRLLERWREEAENVKAGFRRGLPSRGELPITIRGGGDSTWAMALMPPAEWVRPSEPRR
jgi:hypothetical protein